MVSQFRFQIGKLPFQTIVGVWNAYFVIIVPAPQIQHIAFDAQIRATQSPVHVMALAGSFVSNPFFKEIRPFIAPLVKDTHETFFIRVAKHLDNA